jgi:hypothetical protein
MHRQTNLYGYAEGQSIQFISTQLGLNFATLYQVLRRAGWVLKQGR